MGSLGESFKGFDLEGDTPALPGDAFYRHHIQTGWRELDASGPILGVFSHPVVGSGFAAGHPFQSAGQFGGPCDDNRNHEPCSLPRVD